MTIIGKGGKGRLVPLLPEVKAIVDDYIRLCPFPVSRGEPCSGGHKGACCLRASCNCRCSGCARP